MKKKLFTLLTLLLCLCSGAWAQDPTVTNPATQTKSVILTEGGTATSQKFLDVANTTPNVNDTYLTYDCTGNTGNHRSVLTAKNNTWYSGETNNTVNVSEQSYSSTTMAGFIGWTGPATVSTLAVRNTSRHRIFFVTGVTGVAVLGAESSSNYFKIHIEELTTESNPATVGTDAIDASANTSLHVLPHGSTLNAAKFYKVVVLGSTTSNACFAQIRFTPGAGTPTHSVTVNYNGEDAYGTASAASSAVAEGGTTVITAVPATGYQVTNWAVSDGDKGASIDPSGASNSLTTTLTMGTANATVTATFSAINYAITHGGAANGTYTIQVGDKAAINGNTTANYGQTITLAASPADGYVLTEWNVTETVSGESVTVTNNQFTMPAAAVTIAPTFSQLFTLTYDANGGTGSMSDSKGNGAITLTANAYTKSGYRFMGWATSQANADAGTVAYADKAAYNLNADATIFAVWGDLPNVYYYKDATHYTGGTYKNPQGGDATGGDNVSLTTPWTINDGTTITGLTSVVATGALYDNKNDHMNSYIKLRSTEPGKIVFTIASGYKATISIKMGGYSSANTNITMKLNDEGDNITYSGTMSGAATTENGYALLTYPDLLGGAYTLKPTSGSLYISEIDIATEAVPTYTVTHTLSHVTATSGTTGAGAATEGSDYTAVFAAETGYDLPSSVTVTAGETNITANCTWDKATGSLTIPAASITGNIEIIVIGVVHTAPTAGILFSADVIVNSNQSFSSGTTEVTSSQATITGGKMYAISGQSSNVNLIAPQNNVGYFCMTNNNTIFKIVLNDPLDEGDIITVNGIGGTKNSDAKGLWITISESRPGSAPACSGTSSSESLQTPILNYTVTSSDEYVGKTTLYIYRAAGSNTYFDNVTIMRPASVSVGAKGYATYCNNETALDFTGKSIKAYIAENANGNEITFTQVNKIAKGEPVLLYSETNSDSQLIPAIAESEATKKSTTENYFRAGDGTTAYEWADEDGKRIYVLNTTTKSPGFYKANKNKVATTRAYLSMPSGALARFSGLVFDGETTGISNLNVDDNLDADAPMYNLAGQRVTKSYKGVVIVNGKKMLNK